MLQGTAVRLPHVHMAHKLPLAGLSAGMPCGLGKGMLPCAALLEEAVSPQQQKRSYCRSFRLAPPRSANLHEFYRYIIVVRWA